MDHHYLIGCLQRFARILPTVVDGLDLSDWRWKPPGGAWSILEVVRHLADEEVEDFRQRLRMTLSASAQAWPPIDPEGWAVQRHYNDGDPQEALQRFCDERQASIAWLQGLKSPDWSRAYQHPKFGPIHAGDLLAAWASHDALHLRQIAKRLYEMTGRSAGDYSIRYAGQWSA